MIIEVKGVRTNGVGGRIIYTLKGFLAEMSKITGVQYNTQDWTKKLEKNGIKVEVGAGKQKKARYIYDEGAAFIINTLISRGFGVDKLKDFAKQTCISLVKKSKKKQATKTDAATPVKATTNGVIAVNISADEKIMVPVAPNKKEIKSAWTKAFYYDSIMGTKDCLTTTMIAKAFGLKSAQTLNKILCENKIQYKQRGQYVLAASYANKGYAKTQTFWVNKGARPETVWTYEGKKFLYDLLKGLGYGVKKQ